MYIITTSDILNVICMRGEREREKGGGRGYLTITETCQDCEFWQNITDKLKKLK